VSNNIVHLHLFHAQLVPNGILINANAFHKKYVFHQPEDALKANNGINNLVNVNAYPIYLVVQIPKYGVMNHVNANVLLLLKDVHKERNGIVINVNANVLNLQENAYCPNNGIHKHVLVSV
jgi:hypothetical protein